MKISMLLAAAAVSLTGCSGGNKCDTADSACNAGGGGGTPVLQNVNGACTGSTCTWTAEATGSLGNVELSLIENGDPTYDCSQPTEGNLVCGVWSEYHDAFQLTDFNDTSETKSINLNIVADYTQQVNNESTLFDMNDATISNQTTVMFVVYDENGGYADCATYGYDPSYFSSDCSNNWN